MTLQAELADLLNRHSVENGSDTPDWILAQYLLDCLDAFEQATLRRRKFYGVPVVSDRVTRLTPLIDALSDDMVQVVEKILLPTAAAVSRAQDAAEEAPELRDEAFSRPPPGVPDEVAAMVEKARLAGCNIEWTSSRMCEVGTKGCVVRHGAPAVAGSWGVHAG